MKKVPLLFCSTRLLLTWLVISAIACLLYAFIVWISLLNKSILPEEDGPDIIPYVNVPRTYNIVLKFNTLYDKSNTTYSGSVSIDFIVQDPGNRIFIHIGSNVDIKDYHLYSSGKEKSIRKGTYNSKSEIQTFISNTNLTMSTEYQLNIDFTGKLSDSIGAAEYSYLSATGKKRFGVKYMNNRSATIGLRYLIPCFDTPQFAANFSLNIQRSNTLRTLSNFIVEQSTSLSSLLMSDSIPSKISLLPSQLSIVLTDLPYQRQSYNNIQVSVYYRPNIMNGVNIRRLTQFMDKSANTIGKIDAIVLPIFPTIHQPGISILNENSTLVENAEFGTDSISSTSSTIL